MKQPQAQDARRGLRSSTIETLRGAEQISIVLKDLNTAVVGCWSVGRAEPDVVLIRADQKWGPHTPITEPLSLLYIPGAQHDLWWRRAVEESRPGDIPVLSWWGPRLNLELAAKSGPLLEVTAHRARNFPLSDWPGRRRPRVGDPVTVYYLVASA